MQRLPSLKLESREIKTDVGSYGSYFKSVEVVVGEFSEKDIDKLYEINMRSKKENIIKYLTILILRKPVSFSMQIEDKILFLESWYEDLKQYSEYAIASACISLRRGCYKYFPEDDLLNTVKSEQRNIDEKIKLFITQETETKND